MSVFQYAKQVFFKTNDLSFTLFKIMIPIIIAIKILEELGIIIVLSELLEPIMELMGLPGSMGLVWATAIMSSIYAGLVVFANLVTNTPMTIADVTILSGIMLIAHGIPIESRVAQKLGVRIGFIIFFRISMAVLFGWIMNVIYESGGWLQAPVNLIWQPDIIEDTLYFWLESQLINLLMIYVVILLLLVVLDFLKKIRVIDLIVYLIRPALKVLHIGKEAETITLVGLTVGLSYGAALMIKEAEKGTITPKEVLFSMSLLGLCHAIIEDTLLMMLIGADLTGILLGRIAFSMFVVYLLVILVNSMSSKFIRRYFLHTKI